MKKLSPREEKAQRRMRTGTPQTSVLNLVCGLDRAHWFLTQVTRLGPRICLCN